MTNLLQNFCQNLRVIHQINLWIVFQLVEWILCFSIDLGSANTPHDFIFLAMTQMNQIIVFKLLHYERINEFNISQMNQV